MWNKLTTFLRKDWKATQLNAFARKAAAVVDPAPFSEEEFPVICPKCDYLLRGLPDGRCPECGTPFERGRLLVVQYVVKQGMLWRSRPVRIVTWMGGISIGVVLMLVSGGDVLLRLVQKTPVMLMNYPAQQVLDVLSVLLACLAGGQIGLLSWFIRRNRDKRRRVLEALACACEEGEHPV